jgi:hypothetical protein
MKAGSAMQVDRAIAKAIQERVSKAITFEEAKADLESLRALHARTASMALPMALAHLIRLLGEDDPRRPSFIEEHNVAVDQAARATMRSDENETSQSFAVPPARYEEVEALSTNLVLDPETAWHLPPAFIGDWKDLDQESARAVADRVRAAFPTAWSKEVAATVKAVRAMEMSCYPGFDTVEFLFQHEDGPKQSKLVLLDDSIACWITGASPMVHELNGSKRADGTLYLDISDEAKATEYLHFFCSAIHGEEGPFRIVSNEDEFAAHIEPGKSYEIPDDAFAWSAIERVEDEASATAWRAKATVIYGDALFHSEFEIERTGMVSMLDDGGLADGLPVFRQGMARGLRLVRGSR